MSLQPTVCILGVAAAYEPTSNVAVAWYDSPFLDGEIDEILDIEVVGLCKCCGFEAPSIELFGLCKECSDMGTGLAMIE